MRWRRPEPAGFAAVAAGFAGRPASCADLRCGERTVHPDVSASAASDSARATATRLSWVAFTAAACSAASRFFAPALIVLNANAAPATITMTPITHGQGEGPFGVHSVSSVDISFSRSLGEM
jgi:hypothetical protein